MIGVLEAIIQGLANRINDAGFVSKSGGLLYESTVSTAGGNVIRATAQVAPFADGKMIDVSPDNTQTAITFFTAGPSRVIRQDSYLMQLENEVTITGWINGNRVGTSELADPELAVINLIRRAKFQIDQGSPLRMVDIDFIGDSQGQTFSRWGWDKPEFQYGGHPHRMFQHKFRISYAIATGCETQSVHVFNPAC